MELAQDGSDADAAQVISFTLDGTDEACGTANVTGVANACGIHIHVGSNCSDSTTIGGHFWNGTAIVEDPWQTVMYSTVDQAASEDALTVTTGLTNSEVADRVLVVHDVSGARIACSPMSDKDETTTVKPDKDLVADAANPTLSVSVLLQLGVLSGFLLQ